MANNSDIIKIGFDYESGLAEFIKNYNGTMDQVQKSADGNRIEIQFDADDKDLLTKISELKKLKLENFTLEFSSKGIKEQLKIFDQLEKRIQEIIDLNKGVGENVISTESTKKVLDLFGQINDSLSSLRSVISDVGDGEEFSPLLKTIKEITTAVDTLSKSVSNIGLNVNIETGGMDQKLISSLDAKKQSLLSAYKTQFDAMRAFKPSGATIAMANPENRGRIAALNKQINNFDGGANTDNIDQRITAYKEIIKLMKEVSQLSYGKDIYSDMDSSFKNAVSSATGQVTRVQNELKKANTDGAGLENLFGSQDLSKVVEQLGRIANQFENIAKAASEFKAKFADGIKVESSVQEIETLTKKVKELEEEISKLKASPKTNISTPKNTTSDTAGASADDSKVSIEGEGKAADEAGKSFNKASQAKQEFVDVNRKVKQSAESSADAVKKEAEAAKQVDFTPNTEGFDEIVAKFKYLEQYRDQIEKLVKISKKNKDGGYDVSYNARLKSGTTVDLGESSTPQILKANEVAFDAKKIEKATIANKDLANAIGKVRERSELARQTEEKRQELAQSKAINKSIEQEYKDREKLVDSIANGREQTEKLRQSEEKRQELAQSKAINKALEQEYQEREKNQKAADAQLEKDKKRALEFTKNSSKKLSDAVTKYSYGDSTAATNWTKQLNTGLQNFGDFSNIDGKISKLSGSVERVIANLKRSHETALAALKEEINQETTLQNQKDSFNKSNLNAIDAEIKKREEEGKVFSNMLKEQMDSREKILSGIQKSIETYEKKYNDRSATPADYNQSDTYKKNLGNLSDAINNLKEYKATLAGVSSITDEQKSTISSLTAKCEECANAFKSMSAAQKGSTDLSREKLYSKIGEYLQKNSGMAKEFKVQLKALQKQLENDGPNANVSDLTAQFIRLQSQIREAGQEGRSFLDVLKDKAFYGFVGQLGTYFGFNDFVRYIGEGVNTIRELDTAMTEMRKVSDESVASLKNYQKATFDVADAVGTTAIQIQNSTADWMRLGLSLDDAKEAAKDANILLNVSEFDNIEDATKSLVSMSQAYKDLDKLTIVDKLNEVGNNYAISTDELASALQRSSATLSLMGNTIDEAAALVTTANATIQDADSVAAGLRTISLRLVGTSEAEEELSAMNEEVDAFVKATNSKKQQIIKDYTAVASNQYKGFDILDDNGNYKNTYEILLGIAKVYKEIQEQDKKLGTNHAMALIEELAGKNRSNIASAILQDPKQLEEVLKSSQEANGSAIEELNKQLESVDGRIQKLTNRCQEFWATVIDTDTVKTGISLLTDLVSGATALVDKLGTLPTALGALGAALSVKNVGGRKMFRLLNMPTA